MTFVQKELVIKSIVPFFVIRDPKLLQKYLFHNEKIL